MRQVLGPGALARPRGIGWRGRWEGGSGWGIHITPWLIHVNVWRNPLKCCEVISLQLIKINQKKKKKAVKQNEIPQYWGQVENSSKNWARGPANFKDLWDKRKQERRRNERGGKTGAEYFPAEGPDPLCEFLLMAQVSWGQNWLLNAASWDSSDLDKGVASGRSSKEETGWSREKWS